MTVRVPDEVRRDVVTRLRRIEGQVRGLQRMLDEERDCTEIAQQMGAARAALDRAFVELLAAGLEQCVRREAAGDPRAARDLRRVARAFEALG